MKLPRKLPNSTCRPLNAFPDQIAEIKDQTLQRLMKVEHENIPRPQINSIDIK